MMKAKRFWLGLAAMIAAVALSLAIPPESALATNNVVAVGGIDLQDGTRYFKNGNENTGIPTGTASDYNAWFDPASKTLYLKDLYLPSYNGVCIVIGHAAPRITIALEGNSRLSNQSAQYGVECYTNAEIQVTGEGVLNMTASFFNAVGIQAAALTLNSGTLNVLGAGKAIVTTGSGGLTVNGGT